MDSESDDQVEVQSSENQEENKTVKGKQKGGKRKASTKSKATVKKQKTTSPKVFKDKIITSSLKATKRTVGRPSKAEKLYVVEKIVGIRFQGNSPQYEVKWKGYEETTFEPVKNLTDCTPMLDAFFKKINKLTK